MQHIQHVTALTMAPEHDEILRLRDRMHQAQTRLVALELNQKLLLGWKEEVEAVIDDLKESDKIAAKVAELLAQQRGFMLTRLQARTAVAAVIVATVVGMVDIISRLGLIK